MTMTSKWLIRSSRNSPTEACRSRRSQTSYRTFQLLEPATRSVSTIAIRTRWPTTSSPTSSRTPSSKLIADEHLAVDISSLESQLLLEIGLAILEFLLFLLALLLDHRRRFLLQLGVFSRLSHRRDRLNCLDRLIGRRHPGQSKSWSSQLGMLTRTPLFQEGRTKDLHRIVRCVGVHTVPENRPHVPANDGIEDNSRRGHQGPQYRVEHVIFLNPGLNTASDAAVPFRRL